MVAWKPMTPMPPLKLERDLFLQPVHTLSLYIHIPFCSSRCRYCDFYFETGWSPRVMGRTLDRVVAEAGYFFETLGKPRINTIYFGGGTPSVIPPRELDDFLDRLRRALTIGERQHEPAEWSFEMNPESVSPELLAVLRDRGVNRLSLGVQSFQDPLLRFLTRRATRERATEALDLIARLPARAHFPHLNIDLITGIPGQSRQMVTEDIERALSYGPDHFSVYSLTVEERTPLAQMVAHGQARPLPVEQQDSLWFAARDRLLACGFEHYEISNFALPGGHSLHNAAYWRLDPYVGLGPGAVSTVPATVEAEPEGGPASRQRSVARLTNPNLFIYSSAFDPSWNHEVELISPRSLLIEHFLTGLRTAEGVSLRRIERVFGLDLTERWERALAEWVSRAAIDPAALQEPAPRLALTQAARLLLDRFLLEIDRLVDGLGPIAIAGWPPPHDGSSKTEPTFPTEGRLERRPVDILRKPS